MGIDAEQLDKEADAEFAQFMGQPEATPAAQDKPQNDPAAVEEPQPDAVTEPELPVEPQDVPTPDENVDWQDKFNKAEESRKNAHALMTQATQKAADLERSNQQLQQDVAQLRAQLQAQASTPQPPTANAPTSGDQFHELREDYEELAPVFNTLDESQRRNQELEQRLAAIEQHRQQQEQTTEQERFWNAVREVHPDVDQVAVSDDFKGWFARQSKDIQELSQVNPVGAAQVMSLYKQSASAPSETPQHSPNQKFEQAQQLTEPQVRTRTAPNTQGRVPQLTPEQIAALPQKDFDANEAQYDKMLEQWFKQGGRL